MLIEFAVLRIPATYTQPVSIEHRGKQVFKRYCFVAKNHSAGKYRNKKAFCQGGTVNRLKMHISRIFLNHAPLRGKIRDRNK